MTTFSQLIDDLVIETRRVDLKSSMVDWLNQTIREVHFDPERGNVVEYISNLKESQLVATKDQGQTWDIPNPALWQKMSAVQYPAIFSADGEPTFAKKIQPGPGQIGRTYVYYQAGPTFVFSNYGGVGACINLAYLEFPRRLKYIEAVDRPAIWDDDDGWSYAEAVTTPEQQLAAQEAVSNWLLLRWRDVLAEGLRAKIYKRLADEVRMRVSFSLYSSLRAGIMTSEMIQGDLL